MFTLKNVFPFYVSFSFYLNIVKSTKVYLCVNKLTWSSIWAMEQSENLKLYSLVFEFIIADDGAMM